MNLYIRLKNWQPFEHPIVETNFIQAFPDVDLNNLPEWIIPFNRIQMPALGIYEVYEGTTYTIVNGVATDVHSIRPMTNDEKIAKQEYMKSLWTPSASEQSWVFNPNTCQYEPPVA
jgi:hypothetical protein